MEPSSLHSTRLAGTARRDPCAWPALLERLGAGLVPPFPGPGVVPLVVVPPPPQLDPAAPLAERTRRVALAYKGAVERRTGERVFTITRDGRGPGAAKHALAFAEAAQALTEHRAAPAAWCAFSVDVWLRYAAPHARGRARVPPVGWVCAGARVDERLDWFRSEAAARYAGGQLWVGELHRQLVVAWRRVQRELLGLGEPTRARAAAVVRRTFPDGVWDVRVARARVEAEEAQAMLEREAAAGGFLW